MSEPFLAEIMIVGFNFAPRGFAQCDGQILPINQNQSLYSLLGTTYGGDGRTTFALPDLRGRVPVHVGNGGGHAVTQGERAGEASHALAAGEIPPHNHLARATDATPAGMTQAGNLLSPTGGGRQPLTPYGDPDGSALTPLAAASIGNTGSGGGHNNMQPSLALNFVIALQGLFPSRN
jgi:microcystin-dependent protein